MRIPLDRQSKAPLYQQIEAFLRESIQSGSLAPHTRLPAIRRMAEDLGVNRITVENAYAELEADGLVCSRVGSGTYVLPDYRPAPPHNGNGMAWPLWQQELAARRQAHHDGLLSPEVLAGASQVAGSKTPAPSPELITFASGVGDSRLFPVEELRKIIQTVMRRDGVAALGYGEPRGYEPLRTTIAQVLASQGIGVRPDNILITAGSQQAISLVTQVLLKPNDAVLVEVPTYGGALALFTAAGLRLVGVLIDENGMRVDELEKLLQQHHPKLIYTIPNFHNPTGTCLSGQRRSLLITLADRYNIPILEDDFVGDFRYEGRAQPALKALDPGGRVIFVSTFSKMLMPGLRVGFLAADGPIYEELVYGKRYNDMTTSNLIQRALESYVTVGRFEAHLHRSCQVYRKRRDTMLWAIKQYLPAGVQVRTPQGGLFIWAQLPAGLSANELLPLAWEEGATFAPGRSFFPTAREGRSYMRLNFAAQPPEAIIEGIKRLGRAMAKLDAERDDVATIWHDPH